MSVEAISWALNLAPVPANRMLDPRLEHEHDPGQRRPVIGPLAAGVPVPAGRGRRQLRRDPIPQHIRDKIIDHLWQVPNRHGHAKRTRRSHSEIYEGRFSALAECDRRAWPEASVLRAAGRVTGLVGCPGR